MKRSQQNTEGIPHKSRTKEDTWNNCVILPKSRDPINYRKLKLCLWRKQLKLTKSHWLATVWFDIYLPLPESQNGQDWAMKIFMVYLISLAVKNSWKQIVYKSRSHNFFSFFVSRKNILVEDCSSRISSWDITKHAVYKSVICASCCDSSVYGSQNDFGRFHCERCGW